MHHIGTQPLETERLRLRRFVPSDAPVMFRNWASDAAVCQYMTWPPHASREVTAALIDQWIDDYRLPNQYNWVLELKATGEIIGNCSAVRMDESVDEIELGYCMGSRWWGQGLMPEAVGAILGYLFGRVGAKRISAKHDINNPKSGRVMQKVGMTFEGVRRQAFRNNCGICDSACYSILADEYFAAHPAMPVQGPSGDSLT